MLVYFLNRGADGAIQRKSLYDAKRPRPANREAFRSKNRSL